MLKAIDLFAGAGGFSQGFISAGYKITKAVEFDSEIAKTYQHNHPDTKLFIKDIKEIDNNKYFKKSEADLIIGGPPCQGFSMAGARIRDGFVNDPRNYLFKHYFNIVKIIEPKIFILENVKGLMTIHKGAILNQIIDTFQDSKNFSKGGYKINYVVAKAKDLGIPQKRERIIIIGSKKDFNLQENIDKTKDLLSRKFPNYFDDVCVWDAISNLPKPTINGYVNINDYKTQYQSYLKSKENVTYNHNATHHSKKALDRIKKIKINENFISLNEDIKSIHSGSYGRIDPNDQSQTITTRFDTPSGGKFIHPYENRTITAREAARLQSFPDEYEFLGTKTSICKQIGNAVPPKLAYFFAIMIKEMI